MPRGRKVSPEQIVVMLRQSEVRLGHGTSLALACRRVNYLGTAGHDPE